MRVELEILFKDYNLNLTLVFMLHSSTETRNKLQTFPL